MSDLFDEKVGFKVTVDKIHIENVLANKFMQFGVDLSAIQTASAFLGFARVLRALLGLAVAVAAEHFHALCQNQRFLALSARIGQRGERAAHLTRQDDVCCQPALAL